jgi:hypothetical protein
MIHPDDIPPLLYCVAVVLCVTMIFPLVAWLTGRTDNSQEDARNGSEGSGTHQHDL